MWRQGVRAGGRWDLPHVGHEDRPLPANLCGKGREGMNARKQFTYVYACSHFFTFCAAANCSALGAGQRDQPVHATARSRSGGQYTADRAHEYRQLDDRL